MLPLSQSPEKSGLCRVLDKTDNYHYCYKCRSYLQHGAEFSFTIANSEGLKAYLKALQKFDFIH
jgi:hypothetical protein